MRLCVFALHDTAIKAFAQPFFMPTEAAAIRAFTALVNDKNSTLNQSPGDYSLWFLGTFDDTSGNFTTDMQKQLAKGIAVYNSSPPLGEQPKPAPADLNGRFNSENLAP